MKRLLISLAALTFVGTLIPRVAAGLVKGDVSSEGMASTVGCTFIGKDVKNVNSVQDDCARKCTVTPGCSPYTWMPENVGACWTKKRLISKQPQAVVANDPTTFCGVIAVDIYKGSMLDGKKHGRGQHTWANGDHYDGDWLDDQRTGTGTFTSVNNMHDKGLYRWYSGDRYEGQWVKNKKHRFGTFIWPNGDQLSGVWRDNKKTSSRYIRCRP